MSDAFAIGTCENAPTIAVIDYGIGNMGSVRRSLESVGAKVILATTSEQLQSADGAILPGVGSIGRAMAALDESKMTLPLLNWVGENRPLLGICVGMQMLHGWSTESGGVRGLGIFDADVVELSPSVKRPQMQWNRLNVIAGRRGTSGGGGTSGVGQNCDLLTGCDEAWFYFVHSFAPVMHENVVASVDYGGQLGAVVQKGNTFGTQFHPEKSSKAGLMLLTNFLNLVSATQKG